MTTICPAYEGSESTSWYPVMQVLITTSPVAWVAWPPRSPSTLNPSSRTRTIEYGMLHHALGHDLAATDCHHHASAQSATLEWRVLATTLEGRRIDRPLFVGIDQDPFVLQRLADDLSRSGYTCAVDDATVKAEPEDHPHGRLEAMEAVRAGLLRRRLMRRVVGGDHVDHAIDEGLTQGILVIGRAQGRVDIALLAHGPRILLCQREVVRRDLGRHPPPLGLRPTNQVDRAARAHMLHMEARARDVDQGIEGIRNRSGLGIRAVPQFFGLGVDQDREPGFGGCLEGTAKHVGGHRMPPIVG